VEYGIRDFEGQREAMTIFTYSGYIKGWQRCHYFTTNVPSEVTNYWIVWCHRVVYQAIVWIMGIAFIAMIPHTRQFYTESGGYTIYPYLLQIFFFALERNFIRFLTGRAMVPYSNVFGWVCIILSVPAVNLLLSHYWCRKMWWIIFEPSWLDPLLFDTPNKTLSAFNGKDMTKDISCTSQTSVGELVRIVSDKSGISSQKLGVYFDDTRLGGEGQMQNLEELSDFRITKVLNVSVDWSAVAWFRGETRIKINAYGGYGSLDFLFSAFWVVFWLGLIALTKRSVPLPIHHHSPTVAGHQNATAVHHHAILS